MSSIWDLDLKEFRDKIASADPTPGGGSVAAVAATEGLALVIMALEVTAKRKDTDAQTTAPKLQNLRTKGRVLLEALSAHVDKDIQAFENYMAALHMPKASPDEEEKRKIAIAEAGRRALEAPLQSAEDCIAALTFAREAIEVVHAGIASDVGAGAALLHGALTATLYNVDINIRGISDSAKKEAVSRNRDDLQRKADELATLIAEKTLARIKG